MKHKIFFSVILIFLLNACSNTQHEESNIIEAKPFQKITKAGKTGSAAATAEKPAVPDFTAPDIHGNPVTLSNFYKGKKIVLIDFWASWCKPCRMENPNVVAAYKKYHTKGLDIISISLDETKNNWINAITNDKLTWTNVSDLKFWDSEIAKLYHIQSIPTNFLIDGNGKLLANDLRGVELDLKLQELLK